VILIDPDINIKEKFSQIELPCNSHEYMNNSVKAPIRTPKKQPPAPKRDYESDEEVKEEPPSSLQFPTVEEQVKQTFNKDDVDFNKMYDI